MDSGKQTEGFGGGEGVRDCDRPVMVIKEGTVLHGALGVIHKQ